MSAQAFRVGEQRNENPRAEKSQMCSSSTCMLVQRAICGERAYITRAADGTSGHHKCSGGDARGSGKITSALGPGFPICALLVNWRSCNFLGRCF